MTPPDILVVLNDNRMSISENVGGLTRMLGRMMASNAMNPAVVFNSSFTICPSDFPWRRMEQKRITKSCTAPPSTTPMRIHNALGR